MVKGEYMKGGEFMIILLGLLIGILIAFSIGWLVEYWLCHCSRCRGKLIDYGYRLRECEDCGWKE